MSSKWRLIATGWGIVALSGGCGESSGNTGPGVSSGGQTGAGQSGTGQSGSGANQQSGGAGGTSGALGGGAPSSNECPEAPSAPTSADATLEMPITFVSGGAPLVIGENTKDSEGADFRASLLKIFLSSPELESQTGEWTPAQFVDAAGSALPYGLFLLDPEEADPKFRLRGPAGEYVALRFTVGLPASCNGGDPTRRVFPLNADSDMYWTWGSSYLFVRFEGQLLTEPNSAFAYHLGVLGEALPPTVVRLAGTLPLPSTTETGSGPELVFDVGRVIAPRPAGVSSHQLEASWMFENLEQRAFELRP